MDKVNFLIIRILLQFWNSETGSIGCTQIARTLGEEKYTISRAMAAMETEGLLNRRNSRHPVLTNIGKREAQKYAERMNVIQNHLIYEGLDSSTASRDSFYWAVYSSDKTLDMICDLSKRYRIRYDFRDQKKFTGADLCSQLPDGSYTFPFLIYREQVKNGNNISMANDGFEHPCTLQVKEGSGKIYLHALEMSAVSGITHIAMKGSVSSLKYFQNGDFITAEKRGSILEFPADSIQFQSVGAGSEQMILHGTIRLKMNCTVGPMHMPESSAIFTLLI